MANRLVKNGVIKQDEIRFQWVIPSFIYPELNGPAKYGIKEQIRTFILSCGEGNLHNLSLVYLLHASKLLKLVFTRDERRTARQRIYELITHEALGNEVAQSIEEIGK